MITNREQLIDHAIALHRGGKGWKKILPILKKESLMSGAEVHQIWDEVRRLTESGEISETENSVGSTEITTGARDRQSIADKCQLAKTIGRERRSNKRHHQGNAEADEAWAGLAQLAGELSRRWYEGGLGELGTWRAKGEPSLKAGTLNVRQFVAKGGEGEYILERGRWRNS